MSTNFEPGFQTSDPIMMVFQVFYIMVGLLVIARFFYVMGKYQVFSDEPVCINRKCPNRVRGMTEAQADWQRIRELLIKVVKECRS